MLQHVIEENDVSRKELGTFIAQLGDAEFQQAVGNGWTVATVFCHLSFWDQRALYLLQRWQSGDFEAFRLTPQAINSINEAAKVIAGAVPGRTAAQLALSSAEAVDAEIAQLGDDLAEKILSAWLERLLHRSVHRRAHLQKLKEKLQIP